MRRIAYRDDCRERASWLASRSVRTIVGMTVKEILARLESLGDDARRAHNTNPGAPDNQFGVKLGDIRPWPRRSRQTT